MQPFKKLSAIFCCVLLQLNGSALVSEAVSNSYTNKETGNGIDVEISQGYRRDKLKWSISGPHGKPNIGSETTYSNLHIYQTRFTSQFKASDYFAKLQFGYGYVINGRGRDSDYGRNDRMNEFSRVRSKVRNSHIWDTTLRAGKDFRLSETCTVSPLVGYMWEVDSLRTKHGKQTYWPLQRVKHLNSAYKARWDAPFIGVRASLMAATAVQIYAEYDFLFRLYYHANGHRNLLHLKFREHSKRSKGFGQMGQVGVAYTLFNNCFLKLEYALSELSAKGGMHTWKRHQRSTLRQHFHKARQTSSEVRLCFDYAF